MIKIPKDNRSLTKLSQKHYNALLKRPYRVNERLEKSLARLKDKDTKKFIKTLLGNIETVLSGNPKELENFINKYHSQYTSIFQKKDESKERKREIKRFNNAIADAFNYKRFCEKMTGWGAYSLMFNLKVEVCLYCNRLSTATFVVENGKSRPYIDHWSTQKDYPYLSISFYNMIPSCDKCNTNGKGTKSFLLNTHIHPYIEGYEDSLLFNTGISKDTYFQDLENSIKIDFIPGEGFNKTRKIIKKARRNVEELLIREFYKSHTSKAATIIEKSLNYNKALKKTMGDYSSTNGIKVFQPHEIKNRIIQNLLLELKTSASSEYNIESKDFHKTPLSKFCRDIAKEVGLI